MFSKLIPAQIADDMHPEWLRKIWQQGLPVQLDVYHPQELQSDNSEKRPYIILFYNTAGSRDDLPHRRYTLEHADGYSLTDDAMWYIVTSTMKVQRGGCLL